MDDFKAFAVPRCRGCGHAVYPARVLCPRCGAGDWDEVPVHRAERLESTVVTGGPGEAPAVIATLRTDAGPLVLARVPGDTGDPAASLAADPGSGPGRRYRLVLAGAALLALPEAGPG